ncbi:MAG TPA: hypothetical protein VGF29_03875 [Hyphomicrobiaceae bacterium]|jgi:hypothetical protein
MTLAEFERLLDIYGADRTRWPADARAAAAHLAAREAEACRLLAEAEALDRVLQSAPVPALAVEAALAERIVAAAQRSPRIVKLPAAEPAADDAAPVRAAAMPGDATARDRRLGGGTVRLWSRQAGAVGLLAASLAIGVVIGHSNLSPQLLPALADMAGLVDHDDLVQIALSDEVMQ